MSGRGVVSFPLQGACEYHQTDVGGKVESPAAQPPAPAAGGPLRESGGRASVGGYPGAGKGSDASSPLRARVPAQVSQDYLTNILLWSPQAVSGD